VTRVLVIDDEAPLRRALRTSLTARDYEVIEAVSGHAGVLAAADNNPDLVVLDLGLPDLDGMEVLARLRGFANVPVIVLTARDRQGDKVAALDAGADDYVTKPFDPGELLARIRAALRRTPTEAPRAGSVTAAGDIEIDLARQLVTRGGQPVALTRTERRLLEVMVTNPGRLLPHDFLLREVWGQGYGTEANYLRTFVGQLRRKLGDSAADPRLILTEAGIGYRWIGSEGTGGERPEQTQRS
jgi:two-component system KDP operon response regulator KdpE